MGTVVLLGPGGKHGPSWTVKALVDTGADYLSLPEQAARAVGISLANTPQYKTLTARGPGCVRRKMVDAIIQGKKVAVPANFGRNSVPLIGRQAIFQVLRTAGFSTTEWLLDRHSLSATVRVANYKIERRLVDMFEYPSPHKGPDIY